MSPPSGAAFVCNKLGLSDKTVVLFFSDNGGLATTSKMGPTSNLPLRSGKGWLYEGGVREPTIIRAPGVTRPGSVCEAPIISMDFFPTILDIAGLDPAPKIPLDGESLLPLLRQSGSLERDAIYFHYPNYAFHGENRLGGAIREGNYKLIEFYVDGAVELYDVVNDIGEEHDLSEEMPDRASSMKAKLDRWLESSGAKMPRPLELKN